MSLDAIVQISIDTQTTNPTRRGFGTILIAGYHTRWVDSLTRRYQSLADMIADGFTTSDAIYKAARAVFAQQPRVVEVMIGRFDVANTMIVELDPVVNDLHEYSVKINGTTFPITSDEDATAAEIVDALVTAINAGAEPVTASNVGNVLRLTADVAGDLFDLTIDYRDFARQDITTDTADVAEQLAQISNEDDTWYGLITVDNGAESIANAAEYIETVKKVYVAVTGDSDVLDGVETTDVASVLKSQSYARTAAIFSRVPHEYASAAWMGGELPRDPGSNTWKFKTLRGVTVDTLNASEVNALETKRCNYYRAVSGVNITQQGVTASAEFIDVTIFVDWLAARIQERLFTILVNRPKVPFTDQGIQLIEGAILAQLRDGVEIGGLVDDDVLQVIVPRAADVASANKLARRLTPVTFQGTLAGAVHEIVVRGTVTV